MKNDKLRNSTLILGEGPTEFYYFNSLRGEISGVTIAPDYPKHTNVAELGKKIAEGIAMGYPLFLYYFRYTSKLYNDQEALIADLNKECPYEKTQAFFIKCKGLHKYFEKHGGSLSAAIRMPTNP